MTNATCYITLVHGTFGRHGAWVRAGSSLRKHLETQIGGVVEFEVFQWTGWPSHLARHRAAMRLRGHLNKRIRECPASKHIVISHSHGGNLVLYAMRDPELARQVDGVVTLSTPFLVTRRRELSVLGSLSFKALYNLLIMVLIVSSIRLLLFLKDLEFPFLSASQFPSIVEALGGPLLFYLLPPIFIAMCMIPLAYFERVSKWFERTLALPPLRPEQLFIVRGPTDEANAFLRAVDLLQILLTSFWGRKGRIDSGMRRSLEWASEKRDIRRSTLSSNVVEALILISGLLTFLYIFDLTLGWGFLKPAVNYLFDINKPLSNNIEDSLPLTIAIMASAAPFIFLLVATVISVVSILVFATTIGTIVVLALIGIMLLMLTVIPELGPIAAVLIVSTEASPPGRFEVLQLGKNVESSDGTLMHSVTYNNSEALNAIAEWITARMKEGGHEDNR